MVKLSAVWLGPSVPVAAALAFLLTPWAMGSQSIHRPSWAIGCFSVVLGAPAVGVALAAVSPVQDLGEAFALVVFSTLFGLIFVGWLYLIITVPSGYVWASIVRRRLPHDLTCLIRDSET